VIGDHPASDGPSAAGSATVATDGLRRGQDRRLVVPALAGWSAAFWATAQPAVTVTAAAVLSGVLAAGAAAFLARQGLRRPGPPTGAGVVVAAVALTVAVVAGVLACTATRLSARASGPLPGWIRERATVGLTGRVVGDPRVVAAGRFPGQPRVAVQVQVHRVDLRGQQLPTSVPMLVLAPAGSGPGSWSAVSAGQRVRLRGRLVPPDPGDEPVALVSARGAPQRIELGSWPWRLADRVRAGLRTACRGLGPDSAGLLPSLVVGDTSALSVRLQADLKASGLAHLTAVSGANVAIFVGAIAWVAAAAGAARRTRLAVSALALVGFVVLARPSPSVLRAATMAGVAQVGLASARRPRGLPVLAAAVVLLLGGNPWLARSPGFALSAVATGGLLLLAPVWAERLAGRMPRPLALALAAPAAAQAACSPVLVLLAPSVSLAAVPANLLADPAVAPATLLGVGAAVLSLVWPQAAHLSAWLGSLATDWIALVAHRGAVLPLADLPWPGGPGGAVLLGALTAVLIGVTAGEPGRRRRVRAVCAFVTGAAPDAGGARAARVSTSAGGATAPVSPDGRAGWGNRGRDGNGRDGSGRDGSGRDGSGRRGLAGRVVAVISLAVLAGWFALPLTARLQPWPGQAAPEGWLVVMCDVGQGDALAVRSGSDRAVLVDVGPDPAAVDRCLRWLGIHHIDLVVVTHFHADHAFGLPGVLRGRDVGSVWVSPLQEPAGNAEAVRRWAAEGGVRPVRAWAGAQGGSGLDGWRVRWRVLEPRLPPVASGDLAAADGTVVNESSVALVIEVGGPAGRLRLLDLGDLETERQEQLAERFRSGGDTLGGPVDLVKVAHHGSSRQSSALYASCGALIGLIGVGRGNDYGHPSPAALGMLAGHGVRVLRTDTAGDLAVERSPDGIRVTSRR
jgi:competence protein ComEC